ncbi:hypothetical protein [Bacillus toyonensis]|uniref:hypothetical protein n=1 Tax=Bacillus toyonensis TaxID=155322 RepID=UPI002E22479C|nr:hypothetical protein [Bacillus toyonensis]
MLNTMKNKLHNSKQILMEGIPYLIVTTWVYVFILLILFDLKLQDASEIGISIGAITSLYIGSKKVKNDSLDREETVNA